MAQTVWQAELAPLVERWWSGEQAQVQAEAGQILRTASTSQIQNQADMLIAMCLLRSPVRSDITDGRSIVARVGEENPNLAMSPSVEFALAVGHRTLFETTAALTKLMGLTRQLQAEPKRLAVVYEHLAETWLIHNEWAGTPFADEMPDTPEEMVTFRLRRLNEIAEKARELQFPQNTKDMIEWAIIRVLKDAASEALHEESFGRMQRLAQQPLSPASIAARWELVTSLEAKSDWQAIDTVLKSLLKSTEASDVLQAQEMLAELAQPSLELELPDVVRPNNPASVQITARNLDKLSLTVRRVELAEWLDKQRGRFESQQLPIAGSLVSEHQLDGSNQKVPLPNNVGHYVLHAVGSHPKGQIEQRRLLQVSAIDAHLTLGRLRAVLWLPGMPQDESANLIFWMRDAFVPFRRDISQRVTNFGLPGEARVFKDKRWLALIRIGQDSLLLRGNVPVGKEQRDRVVFTGSPFTPRVGETYRLSGRLLSQAEQLEPLQVLFEGSDGKLFHQATISPDASGVFSTEWQIPLEVADLPIRVRAVRGREAIPPATDPFNFRPQAISQSKLYVHYLGETQFKQWTPFFEAWQAARYPWELSTARSLKINAAFDFYIFPEGTESPWSIAVGPYGAESRSEKHLHSNPDSQIRRPILLDGQPLASAELKHVEVRLSDVGLMKQPLGLMYSVIGYGFDGRTSRNTNLLMLAKERRYAWLAPTQRKAPEAGQPLRLRLNWFDPDGSFHLKQREVRILKDGQQLATLSIYPEFGAFATDAWIPPAAGNYLAQIELSQGLDETYQVSSEVIVLASASTDQRVNMRAELDSWSDPPQVLIELEDPLDEPVIVMLVGSTLSGAAEMNPGENRIKLDFNPADSPTAAIVLRKQEAQLEEIARATIAQPLSQQPQVVLSLAEGPHLPGANLPVHLSVSDPGTALLKLTPRSSRAVMADRYGFMDPFAEKATLALSFSGDSGSKLKIAPPRASRAILGPWSATPPLWHQAFEIEGEADLEVRLPTDTGIYDLDLELITASGTLARANAPLLIDAPITVEIDTPERLLAGDRPRAAFWLKNPTSQTQSGKIMLSASPELSIENESDIQFDLKPGGEQIIAIGLEAVRQGRAELSAQVHVGTQVWQIPHSFSVVAAPKSSDPRLAPVRIERSVVLLERDPFAANTPDTPNSRWIEITVPSDADVPVGSTVLVRDRIITPQPIPSLEWEQQFGSCLSTLIQDPMPLLGPAKGAQRTADRMTAPLDQLRSGEVFEFVAMALRPGTTLLPPPKLTHRGQTIPVTMQPGLIQLRVTE